MCGAGGLPGPANPSRSSCRARRPVGAAAPGAAIAEQGLSARIRRRSGDEVIWRRARALTLWLVVSALWRRMKSTFCWNTLRRWLRSWDLNIAAGGAGRGGRGGGRLEGSVRAAARSFGGRRAAWRRAERALVAPHVAVGAAPAGVRKRTTRSSRAIQPQQPRQAARARQPRRLVRRSRARRPHHVVVVVGLAVNLHPRAESCLGVVLRVHAAEGGVRRRRATRARVERSAAASWTAPAWARAAGPCTRHGRMYTLECSVSCYTGPEAAAGPFQRGRHCQIRPKQPCMRTTASCSKLDDLEGSTSSARAHASSARPNKNAPMPRAISEQGPSSRIQAQETGEDDTVLALSR